jgi:hypothetical protein
LRKRNIDRKDIFEPVPPNTYPTEKCGGGIRSKNDPYWFALHGVWRTDRQLEMRFVSAFEVWPETWTATIKPLDHEFPWNSNVLKHSYRWKLIQTHGVDVKGQKVSWT